MAVLPTATCDYLYADRTGADSSRPSMIPRGGDTRQPPSGVVDRICWNGDLAESLPHPGDDPVEQGDQGRMPRARQIAAAARSSPRACHVVVGWRPPSVQSFSWGPMTCLRFSAGSTECGGILARRFYRIPRFQRPYGWESSTRGLLGRRVQFDNGIGYFIGPMVGWRKAKESPHANVVIDSND